MPLKQNVLELHKNPVFIETGTYTGESVTLALQLGFTTIHTMDVAANFVEQCQAKYKHDKRVHTYLGDSPDIIRDILKGLDKPTTFWLDAHPIVPRMLLFDPSFPLLRELLTIKQYLRGTGHVILMDDMRTYTAYERGVLDFAMKQLWPSATHKTYDDWTAPGDIYCCVL